MPVLWSPAIMHRGRLWVTTLEHWSDGVVVTWAAAGAHGLMDVLRSLNLVLVDAAGDHHDPGGWSMAMAGPTEVTGQRHFAPAVDEWPVELIVTFGDRSDRRSIERGSPESEPG